MATSIFKNNLRQIYKYSYRRARSWYFDFGSKKHFYLRKFLEIFKNRKIKLCFSEVVLPSENIVCTKRSHLVFSKPFLFSKHSGEKTQVCCRGNPITCIFEPFRYFAADSNIFTLCLKNILLFGHFYFWSFL